MARSGGLVGKVRGGGLGAELAREVRQYAADEQEGPLGIPADQTALVGLAADRIAPAIAKQVGLVENEEAIDTIGGYLLGVWARALLALDRELVEVIIERRRSGNSDT